MVRIRATNSFQRVCSNGAPVAVIVVEVGGEKLFCPVVVMSGKYSVSSLLYVVLVFTK